MVYLYDMAGFGRSGEKQSANSCREHLIGLKTVVNSVRDNDLPLFILGHSLGAFVTVLFCIINSGININGVILTSPLLQIPKNLRLSFLQKMVLKIVLFFVPGNILVSTNFDATGLVKNNFFIKLLCKNNPNLYCI